MRGSEGQSQFARGSKASGAEAVSESAGARQQEVARQVVQNQSTSSSQRQRTQEMKQEAEGSLERIKSVESRMCA